MRRIIWSPLAVDDLRGIRDYIGQFNPSAAMRFAARLFETAESLAEFSERGRPIGGGRRELVIVWPYVIRYRVEPERVVILRIRHGAQKPLP
ncbi:MAG: type II toxin-antitoxin system RelE/ParE family toxin [Rhizomicrobium sp.]